MKLSIELSQLRVLLQSEVPMSAKELARLMSCSMPTVYARLNALARAGVVIIEVREPCSTPGPTPTRYKLARTQVVPPHA